MPTCGEKHHKAVLTNHEVELLRDMLDERDACVRDWEALGYTKQVIHDLLRRHRLSLAALAQTFEVSRSCVYGIYACVRR